MQSMPPPPARMTRSTSKRFGLVASTHNPSSRTLKKLSRTSSEPAAALSRKDENSQSNLQKGSSLPVLITNCTPVQKADKPPGFLLAAPKNAPFDESAANLPLPVSPHHTGLSNKRSREDDVVGLSSANKRKHPNARSSFHPTYKMKIPLGLDDGDVVYPSQPISPLEDQFTCSSTGPVPTSTKDMSPSTQMQTVLTIRSPPRSPPKSSPLSTVFPSPRRAVEEFSFTDLLAPSTSPRESVQPFPSSSSLDVLANASDTHRLTALTVSGIPSAIEECTSQAFHFLEPTATLEPTEEMSSAYLTPSTSANPAFYSMANVPKPELPDFVVIDATPSQAIPEQSTSFFEQGPQYLSPLFEEPGPAYLAPLLEEEDTTAFSSTSAKAPSPASEPSQTEVTLSTSTTNEGSLSSGQASRLADLQKLMSSMKARRLSSSALPNPSTQPPELGMTRSGTIPSGLGFKKPRASTGNIASVANRRTSVSAFVVASAAPYKKRTTLSGMGEGMSLSTTEENQEEVDEGENKKGLCLAGVVAFVDVRTQEGDDAGQVFVDILRELGAKVTNRLNVNLTHLIYKAGKPMTVHRYRTHPDPKPMVVSAGWVAKCKENMKRMPEANYVVEIGKEAVFSKIKPKAMQPKALANFNPNIQRNPRIVQGKLSFSHETNVASKFGPPKIAKDANEKGKLKTSKT